MDSSLPYRNSRPGGSRLASIIGDCAIAHGQSGLPRSGYRRSSFDKCGNSTLPAVWQREGVLERSGRGRLREPPPTAAGPGPGHSRLAGGGDGRGHRIPANGFEIRAWRAGTLPATLHGHVARPPGPGRHRAGWSFTGEPSHRVERAAKRPLGGGAPGFRAVGKKKNHDSLVTGMRLSLSHQPAFRRFRAGRKPQASKAQASGNNLSATLARWLQGRSRPWRKVSLGDGLPIR